MNGLLAVVNPSRRRRKHRKSAKRSRRGHRRMTAKQLKYFGPRRHRKVRRARTITMSPNPRRRRRSIRRASRSVRRYRRNPIGTRSPAFRASYITGALQDAGIGAGGAIVTDLAMAQAANVLPATMTSRFASDGSVNWGYYGVKAAIALGLGILGTRFLPGKMRGVAAKGTAGALTVQGYELVKAMLPANIVLGYMTPGRVTSLGRRRMGAYLERPGLRAYLPAGAETRVGEGMIS